MPKPKPDLACYRSAIRARCPSVAGMDDAELDRLIENGRRAVVRAIVDMARTVDGVARAAYRAGWTEPESN